MLSDEQIKELRDSIDLSRIISRKVKLQKRGNNFLGLCPFHNEKTPSFNVNDQEGFYHCFGCGAHGDVISFISSINLFILYAALRQWLGTWCGWSQKR